ncbi:urea transporter [Streptomyces misionensis]|uniref:Urea transporter n=1 Tax=Streptomyces misionensis TaxID=67331 RepID=A0A5C6IU22_9ACTN|nr:urea transporter [Streptomyces misionensis]TWV32608.1 urea transporter [Streptomyces misionensis]
MPTASQAVRSTSWSPVAVGRTQARGIAQVALSASPWTGLLFLVALFADDCRIGVFGLLGTLASTGTAAALRSDRGDRLRQGLEGYCGCLVGIALFVQLGASWRTALLAVLAAAVCSVLSAAAVRLLGRVGLPVLTAPYCLVAGVMAIALPTAPAAPAAAAARTAAPSLADIGHAFCDNIGQVFFLDRWYAGLIVLAGLLVTSWRAAGAAACGSAVAIVTAWVMGLPADRLGEGLYGYNGVLVAIALAATFLTLTPWTAGYAVLAVVASVPFTTAWTAFAQPSGGSPFTWPFVVTTWLFLGAAPAMDRPGMSYEKAK